MKCTFLVLAKDGSVSAYQFGNKIRWGKKEIEPTYLYYGTEITDKLEAETIQQEYYFDIESETFLHKEHRVRFSSQNVLRPASNLRDDEKTKQHVESVLGESVTDASKEIVPTHRNLDTMREYWLRVLFEFREHTGVHELMESVKAGCFGSIFECVEKLEPKIRDNILSKTLPEDKDWVLFWTRGV